MYVTRPLSQLLKSPETVSAAVDGPNSGFLVIQDEESLRYSFFGLFKNHSLKQLPFPQDKELIVQYTTTTNTSDDIGQPTQSSHDPIFLIPALNRPLSSNRYYAIVPHGKRIGEALTCSREADKVSCCFCRWVTDVKPRPLDPRNVYQQVHIAPYNAFGSSKGEFVAKSVVSDGFPPDFLRRKGWTIETKTPNTFTLGEARGLDARLRASLLELDSSRVVGKWYTPFVFVKDGSLRDQVKQSMYYEVILLQRWEPIFKICRDRNNNGINSVVIDATVEKEEVFVGGIRKAVWNGKSAVDGVIWFRSEDGGGEGVGLRVELVERMKWEEERGGWMGGEETQVKIHKVEELGGEDVDWNEFGCYVLVERFNVRRMDGSVLISCDFKHSHKLNTKWA
ncbi:hypothetical protein SASPL_140450 [Salvia splendens]|uniref:Uncharacterized protein n=1 Tax=Salvia splendens TaxID=180675 RepID=A0A8X8WPS3_SALSN|nr:uncharacterized protein LOC121767749 [Salvia splendens]KAG6398978.1 hypothetical protein SASPL_140450 [Salvia splendens]